MKLLKMIIVITMILLPKLIHAGTPVSGYVSGTWDLAGSPYIAVGGLLVDSGDTLTIEPGVTVKFDNTYALQIDGTLIAIGTETDNITFTTNSQGNNWGYILFSDISADAIYDTSGNYIGGCIMEYCIVEYAGEASVSNNGAIRMNNAHPFINHCTIRYNQSTGICAWHLWNLSENLNIYNCSISNNNSATGDGGGIWVGGSTVTIYNCIINNNTSPGWNYGGGGIYICHSNIGNPYSTVTISNSNISNNTSQGNFGGGIFANGTVTIINSIVSNNSSEVNGGGIYVNGTVTVTNSIVSNNSATGYGGGIYVNGTVTITNNSIIGNSAQNAAAVYYPNADFKYNTITGNIATGSVPTYTVYVNSHPLFNYNNILNNIATYELWNANAHGSDNVDATNNWWGTAVESDIANKIWDWFDDLTLGFVDYDPWETDFRTDTPVSPPTGLIATINSNEINLSWSYNPESDITGYKVYWSTTSGFPYSNVVDVGNVNSYTITGITPNIYYITVTAYDNDYNSSNDDPATIVNENQTNGNESWYAEELEVIPGIPPIADFSSDISSGYNPLTVNFFNQSANGSSAIDNWYWDFGDSFTDTLQNPTHIFQNPGIYTVSLTVTDENDSTDTEIKLDYIIVFADEPPAPPNNVNIEIIGNDAVLSWSLVDTTIYGNPANVDYYLIFKSGVPYQESLFLYHGYTSDTTYIHDSVILFADNMFYKVVSYVGNIERLNELIANKKK